MRRLLVECVAGVVLVAMLCSTALAVTKGGTGWPKPDVITGLSVSTIHTEGGTNYLDSSTPIFSWDKPTTPFWDFKLQVRRGTALVYNNFADWDAESNTCLAEIRSAAVEFKPGVYSVKVFGYNPIAQLSATSTTLTFVVVGETTGLPEITQPAAASEISSFDSMTWGAVTNASKYEYIIKKPGGAVFKRGTVGYGYGIACTSVYYSVTGPTKELPGGSCQCLVRAYTPRGGWGAYASNSFSVLDPTNAPAAPVNPYISQYFGYGPFESQTSPHLAIGCDNDPEALWYFFELKCGAATIYRGWGPYSGSPWYETPKDQKPGTYTMRVQSWNQAGLSPWSVTVTQTVASIDKPSTPVNLDFARTVDQFFRWHDWYNPASSQADMLSLSYPYFRWDIVDSCYQYQLRILQNGRVYYTSPALVIGGYHAGSNPNLLYTCGTNYESVYWRCARKLPDGTYTWQVQAKNSMATNALSDWSTTTSLVIDTSMSVPELKSPVGTNAPTGWTLLIGCSTNKLGEVSMEGYNLDLKLSVGITNYITPVKVGGYVEFGNTNSDDYAEWFNPDTFEAGAHANMIFPSGMYSYKLTPYNANGKLGTSTNGTFWIEAP